MPKSKLHDQIKGESDPQPDMGTPEQEMWDADEWQKETAMDVPDVVSKDPRYRNCRFRWLSPGVIGTRGWRRWKTVHVTAAPDEINAAGSGEYQKQVDTVVRRGDLILGYMPEGLARAREAYYRKLNAPQQWERDAQEKLRDRMRKQGAEAFGNVRKAGIRSRKIYQGE